jgi:hypothetical protein
MSDDEERDENGADGPAAPERPLSSSDSPERKDALLALTESLRTGEVVERDEFEDLRDDVEEMKFILDALRKQNSAVDEKVEVLASHGRHGRMREVLMLGLLKAENNGGSTVLHRRDIQEVASRHLDCQIGVRATQDYAKELADTYPQAISWKRPPQARNDTQKRLTFDAEAFMDCYAEVRAAAETVVDEDDLVAWWNALIKQRANGRRR